MMTIVDRTTLKRRIQQIQFMVVELNLYLNTHPCDMRALMQHNMYAQQLEMLKKQYQQMHGPLTAFDAVPVQKGWTWINEPWPWEERE